MDAKLTNTLKTWFETPENERDYAAGALLLLKLSGNIIMYRNIVSKPDKYSELINFQLQKYYNFRVADLTHKEVEEMSEQVDTIVADHLSISTEAENFKKGKREDHDQLPEDIQALYVENLSLLQQMRELHLQLRNLSLDNVTCPDSERYPFLKELINLDKRMHANWDKYDHYILTDA
jgi:hypothetical protein